MMAQKEILPPKAVGFTVINKLKLAIELNKHCCSVGYSRPQAITIIPCKTPIL
jgi:hypothetical protein